MISGSRSAWSRRRKGPEWNRTAENRGSRKRTEIASVKGIGGLPVHEKDLALGNTAAALPSGQRPASVISFASKRHHDAIDHDGETDAADGLTRKGEDAASKAGRRAANSSSRQKLRDRLGRRDDDEIRRLPDDPLAAHNKDRLVRSPKHSRSIRAANRSPPERL